MSHMRLTRRRVPELCILAVTSPSTLPILRNLTWVPNQIPVALLLTEAAFIQIKSEQRVRPRTRVHATSLGCEQSYEIAQP